MAKFNTERDQSLQLLFEDMQDHFEESMTGIPAQYCKNGGAGLRRLYSAHGGIDERMNEILDVIPDAIRSLLLMHSVGTNGIWKKYAAKRNEKRPIELLALPYLCAGQPLITTLIQRVVDLRIQFSAQTKTAKKENFILPHKLILLHQLGYIDETGKPTFDSNDMWLSRMDVADDIVYLAENTSLLHWNSDNTNGLIRSAVEWPYLIKGAAMAARTFHAWDGASKQDKEKACILAWAVLTTKVSNATDISDAKSKSKESYSNVFAPDYFCPIFKVAADVGSIYEEISNSFGYPLDEKNNRLAEFNYCFDDLDSRVFTPAEAKELTKEIDFREFYLNDKFADTSFALGMAKHHEELYGVNPLIALDLFSINFQLYMMQADRSKSMASIMEPYTKINPLKMELCAVSPLVDCHELPVTTSQYLFPQNSTYLASSAFIQRLHYDKTLIFNRYILSCLIYESAALLKNATTDLLALQPSLNGVSCISHLKSLLADKKHLSFNANEFLFGIRRSHEWLEHRKNLLDLADKIDDLDEREACDSASIKLEVAACTELLRNVTARFVNNEPLDPDLIAIIYRRDEAIATLTESDFIFDENSLENLEHHEYPDLLKKIGELLIKLSKAEAQFESIQGLCLKLMTGIDAYWRTMPGWIDERQLADENQGSEEVEVIAPEAYKKLADRADYLKEELDFARREIKTLKEQSQSASGLIVTEQQPAEIEVADLVDSLLKARECRTAAETLTLAADVFGEHFVVTDAARRAAENFQRHDFNAKRLMLVLARLYHLVLPAKGHGVALAVFGSAYKACESEMVTNNEKMREMRCVVLQPGTPAVYCPEHIAIGRHMRVYFTIENGTLYITHCGEHLPVLSSN